MVNIYFVSDFASETAETSGFPDCRVTWEIEHNCLIAFKEDDSFSLSQKEA